MSNRSLDHDFDLMQEALKASPTPRKSGLNDVSDKQENNVSKKRKQALMSSRAREFTDTEALEVGAYDDEDGEEEDDDDNDLDDLIGEEEEEDMRVRKKPRRPAAEKAIKRQEQQKRDFVAEDFLADDPQPKKKRSGAAASKGKDRVPKPPKKAKEPDWYTQFDGRVGLYEQRLSSQVAEGELGWPTLKDKYNALSFDSREASQLAAYLQKKHLRAVKVAIGREDARHKSALLNDAEKEGDRFRKTALKVAYYTLATQLVTIDPDI